MFKAVLVIFVLGIGKGDGTGGNISTTLFQNIDQCNEAIVHIEDVIDDWHYGKDEKDIVPVRKTIKCFPITPEPIDFNVQVPPGVFQNYKPSTPAPMVIPMAPEPLPKMKSHNRWDK